MSHTTTPRRQQRMVVNCNNPLKLGLIAGFIFCLLNDAWWYTIGRGAPGIGAYNAVLCYFSSLFLGCPLLIFSICCISVGLVRIFRQFKAINVPWVTLGVLFGCLVILAKANLTSRWVHGVASYGWPYTYPIQFHRGVPVSDMTRWGGSESYYWALNIWHGLLILVAIGLILKSILNRLNRKAWEL